MLEFPRIRDARDHAAFYLNLSRTGGEVVPYLTDGRPAFLANRPEHVEHVLVRNERGYRNPYHPYAELAGLAAPAGRYMLRLQRGRAPAEVARELDRTGRDLRVALLAAGGEPVEAGQALKEALFVATARLLFGVDPGALGRAFVRATGFVEECWANGLFQGAQQAEGPLAAAHAEAVGLQRRTAAWLALRSKGAQAARPPEEALETAVVRTLLNAYNATATALAWALHLLAVHPDAQERIRDELGGREPTRPEEVRRLPFLRQVVLETLRLYPPAWTLGRVARVPDRLGATDVPAGAVVSVSPYTMHRHLAVWDRPSEFRPERFALRDGGRPRFSFFPFGGGTRRCPAGSRVPGHAAFLLALLLRTCRLEPVGNVPVRPRGLVALRPEPGVWLRVEPAQTNVSHSRLRPRGSF